MRVRAVPNTGIRLRLARCGHRVHFDVPTPEVPLVNAHVLAIEGSYRSLSKTPYVALPKERKLPFLVTTCHADCLGRSPAFGSLCPVRVRKGVDRASGGEVCTFHPTKPLELWDQMFTDMDSCSSSGVSLSLNIF